jgi:ABC-type polysaccharide/polyol phosphate transport system ATPase subunit
VPRERIGTFKEYAIRTLQRRVFHEEFWALRDVSLELRRGEVLGIVGRNGAGKSTLLKVIARVLRPTEGHIWVNGRVAPLLEFGAGFHPELTGRENIFLNGALLGFSQAEMQSKFQGIVDFAELPDFIDAPIRTYSSGMVARLGFAIATDVEPDILIIDELLSVGDAAFQQKSAERIQGFRAKGASILLVSHGLASVQSMCDRVIWLEHGHVMAEGSPDAVLSKYRGDAKEVESKRLTRISEEPKSTNRWGTRKMEIARVRVINSKGMEQSIFGTGDSLVLQMDYVAQEPIHSPIFGMAIHRQDGIHVTGPNTSFFGLVLETIEGSGTVEYTIPYLPILEGLYFITVAVVNADDTEVFDYHDRAYPFRVENENGSFPERYGLMTLRGEWKHVSKSR